MLAGDKGRNGLPIAKELVNGTVQFGGDYRLAQAGVTQASLDQSDVQPVVAALWLGDCHIMFIPKVLEEETRGWAGRKELAGVTGLEPATSAVTGQRSEPIELHPRVRGNSSIARLRPAVAGLRRGSPESLPRSTWLSGLVGAKGLEPLTPSV